MFKGTMSTASNANHSGLDRKNTVVKIVALGKSAKSLGVVSCQPER